MLYPMLTAHNECYLCSAVCFPERTCVPRYSSGTAVVPAKIPDVFPSASDLQQHLETKGKGALNLKNIQAKNQHLDVQ